MIIMIKYIVLREATLFNLKIKHHINWTGMNEGGRPSEGFIGQKSEYQNQEDPSNDETKNFN